MLLDGDKLVPGFSLEPLDPCPTLGEWKEVTVPELWNKSASPLYVMVESHVYHHGEMVNNIDLGNVALPDQLPAPVYPSLGGCMPDDLLAPEGSGTRRTSTRRTSPSPGAPNSTFFLVKPLVPYQLDVGFFVSTDGQRLPHQHHIFSNEEVYGECAGYETYNAEYWLSSPVPMELMSAPPLYVNGWFQDGDQTLETFIAKVNEQGLWVEGARLDILGCRYYRQEEPPAYDYR
jgi:hypothetical protein